MFFTTRNIGNVFSQTSVIAVLALGQLLVIVTRGIDLSVGSTIALSGVVGAIVYGDTSSSVLSIAAILGTGLAVGCANGLIFVYGRVPHPFIVTLATLSIVRGLALWAANGTLIPGMPPIVQTIGGGSINWIPVLDLRRGRARARLPAADDDGSSGAAGCTPSAAIPRRRGARASRRAACSSRST